MVNFQTENVLFQSSGSVLGGGVGGGGVQGVFLTLVGYAMRVVPRKKKSNNTRGFQNIQGKKSKITTAPPLHKL